MNHKQFIQARERLGWTQQQMAQALGMTRNGIWRMELPKSNPNHRPVQRVTELAIAHLLTEQEAEAMLEKMLPDERS